jgi:hypothetical protein
LTSAHLLEATQNQLPFFLLCFLLVYHIAFSM